MKYYHVTCDRDWGETKLLHPRIPKSAAFGEPEIPRICVAPTIAQCFLALEECWGAQAIYYSEEKPTMEAHNVCDQDWTDEAWYLNSTRFHLFKRIPLDALNDAPCLNMPMMQFYASNWGLISEWLQDWELYDNPEHLPVTEWENFDDFIERRLAVA